MQSNQSVTYKKCKCGNAMRTGKTWCDPCYAKLTKKWDKEIQEFLHQVTKGDRE
jgi:hypothetical protein